MRKYKIPYNYIIVSLLFLIVVQSKAQEPNCLWLTKSLEGNESELVEKITTDDEGNVLVVGRYTGNFYLNTLEVRRLNTKNLGNFFIAKLSPSGQPVWVNRIGGAKVNAIVMNSISADSEGNVYISGDAEVASLSDSLVIGSDFSIHAQNDTSISFLVKMDTDGVVLWAQNLMNFGTKKCNSVNVRVSDNQEIYLSGYINGTTKFDDHIIEPIKDDGVFIAKADKNGSYLWAQILGSKIITSNKTELEVNTRGEAFLSGAWEGDTLFTDSQLLINPTPGGFGNLDRFIGKYDSTGTLQWLVREGGTKTDEAAKLVCLDDGSVYALSDVSTTVEINNEDTKVFGPTMLLSKYEPDGSYKFHKELTTNNTSQAMASDGTFMYITWSYGAGGATIENIQLRNIGLQDAGIAKLDLLGNVEWAVGIGNGKNVEVSSLAVSPTADLLMGGYMSGQWLRIGGKTIVNGSANILAWDFFIASLGPTLLGVSGVSYDPSLDVYPNPTTDYVNLTSSSMNLEHTTFKVIDGLGREVKATSVLLDNELRLDVTQLPQGVYFINLYVDNHRHTKKFIKL
jgi:hypothetical protein